MPECNKIYQWPLKTRNVHKIYQHLPLQDPTKFTQIWIFGLKIYHLATLPESRKLPRTGKIRVESSSLKLAANFCKSSSKLFFPVSKLDFLEVLLLSAATVLDVAAAAAVVVAVDVAAVALLDQSDQMSM
jgi:hypothetical protein